MRAAGLSVWHDASVLSVRGYVEVLKKLPQLLMLRRDVIRTAETVRPKVFIGVDAPDFNLAIEEKLRSAFRDSFNLGLAPGADSRDQTLSGSHAACFPV